MADENYKSEWWGYICDQMMTQDLAEILDDSRRFYFANLANRTGRVLDCACGTGLFMLPLLAAGHDVYGFDISESMLATLKKKSADQGVPEIEHRLSVQDLESFVYPHQFDTIIIATNTFSMLTSQAAQIRTLKNIHAHLRPGGTLLLDIELADMRNLAEMPTIQGRWHTWTHPETGRAIRQRRDARLQFDDQLIVDTCYIEYEDEREAFPMIARWIFKDEFQLLLRLAGFEHWDCFGTPEHAPLVTGPEGTQSYWLVHKESDDASTI